MNAWLTARWPWHRPSAPPLRWVVVDVESSGLDPQHDRLLAVAGVAVHLHGRQLYLRPGDSFEVVLRQPDTPAGPDRANILVHGIGVQAQRQGEDPAQALQAWQRFVGDAPLVAFHAGFDRVLLRRHLWSALHARVANPWLDLADLAPALVPGLRAQALDEWLAHFGITVAQRHQAAADTWATAELLQRLWALARTQGHASDFAGLRRVAVSRRWLVSG